MPPRAKRGERVRSALYHTSFTIFLILLAALLCGSAWGLGEQAWRTDHQKRWNMFAMVAAYAAVGIISLSHIWSRVLSVRRALNTMPKPYVPSKSMDLPKKVANHIATEYSRTAVIAHISQATAGTHEGWGRPGTKWDGTHFRTFILDTLPEMRHILLGNDPNPPTSLHALTTAAERLEPSRRPDDPPDALAVFVASYISIVERARYARAEPSESDAGAVEKVVAFVRNLVAVKKKRISEAPRSGSGFLSIPTVPEGVVLHS